MGLVKLVRTELLVPKILDGDELVEPFTIVELRPEELGERPVDVSVGELLSSLPGREEELDVGSVDELSGGMLELRPKLLVPLDAGSRKVDVPEDSSRVLEESPREVPVEPEVETGRLVDGSSTVEL